MSSSSEEKRLTQSTALGEKTTENEQENVGGVDDLTECKSEDDYEDDVHDVVDDDDDDDDIADGIAEDFIEYVMEYVGDDLIDGFIEKLTNGRTKEEIDVRTADKSEDYIQECKADELIKNVLESTNIDMIEKETEQLTGMSDDLTTESAGDDDDDDDDTIRENKTEHSTPIALSDAIKVLQASRHLQIDLLESDCWDLLSQKHVREKVAFRLFLEAEKMPALEDVREIMLSRVRGYFLALVGSEDFLNLKLDQLLSLLKRDSIGVNCEVEVFFAAVRWLSKSKNRLEHMQTVMRCVRFAYMPMPMLFRIRAMGLADENQPIGSTERVLQEFQRHPEMPQMLYDAMTYISLHFQNEMEPDPIDPDDEIQQKLVYPRRWIYHPKCPYHKARLVYPYQHSLTQQEFDNYVCMIQKDWMGEEPPVDAVLDVEFDGVVKLSPKLSSETLAR
ncbi:uncharacterized protein Dvir_GJ18946 [Drosophila virilis]|uniref:BACK domain-containing protein n=1 Tax=Drosophila virilis TaxID=7244 RepID=B4M3I6_DROVI|nr:uncharacterized protein Dvir_GJ18946 [Drosophila virilis]